MNNLQGEINKADFKIDTTSLYREESYTDLKVASIRKMVPVKPDGSDDDTREAHFFASTQLMSPQGPLPIQAPLKSKTLEAAIEEFPEVIKFAIERTIDEIRKMQQKEESRIVVPGR